MTRGSGRRRGARAPVHALSGVLVLTGSLAACSTPDQTAAIQSPSTTVHVAPDQHTVAAAQPVPGDSYAPFLAWKDRDTVAVTTFGSSTAGCLPAVLEDFVDADGAYRAVVALEGSSERDCTDDWAAQEWDLPVPDALGTEALIRLQLADEPETAYEYPMGAWRPG